MKRRVQFVSVNSKLDPCHNNSLKSFSKKLMLLPKVISICNTANKLNYSENKL